MSEPLGPQQGGDEIEEQADRDGPCEIQMQRHRSGRIAQADEGDRQQEKAGQTGEPLEIGHGMPRTAECGIGGSVRLSHRKVSRAKAGLGHKDIVKMGRLRFLLRRRSLKPVPCSCEGRSPGLQGIRLQLWAPAFAGARGGRSEIEPSHE
jgi:hypothetical protein